MPKPKRPDPKAAASWITGGEEHQPAHQARMRAAKAKTTPAPEAGVIVRGGRPKSFEGETERLNVMLPASRVKAIKQRALDQGQTPGQVLDAILKTVFHP